MKKLLVNLLIVLSLVLCGFISFQWHREAKLRSELKVAQLNTGKNLEAIADLEGTLRTMKNEITRLDAIKVEFTENAKNHHQEIGQLKVDLKKAAAENEQNASQIAAYKTALQKANESITVQNEAVKKMSADFKKLAEERNAAITKSNEMIERYNQLVKQFNELQEQTAKSAKAQGSQ